ncbi:MAG TPA: DUF4082 domain-containing protein [Puia sp.]|nr:DUF4082 domain-containing protein [Puia sp.]
MLRSRSLWLLLPVFVLASSTTCTKSRHNPPPRVSTVNPFNQYLAQTGDTTLVTLHPNETPVELGYSFTVSDTGTIYQMGIRLPDTGNVYPVTLWDGVTQAILARQDIKAANAAAFTYIDLTATHAQVSIAANHQYVVSVNMTPTNLPPAGAPSDYNFYDVHRTDRGNIFPMTEGYVTYGYEYTQTSTAPTFPGQLSIYTDFINGIVDIGFSHTVL